MPRGGNIEDVRSPGDGNQEIKDKRYIGDYKGKKQKNTDARNRKPTIHKQIIHNN